MSRTEDNAYRDLMRAYRDLTSEIDLVLCREADSSRWDGDLSKSELLRIFVHWLPDMIRHDEARRLRRLAGTHRAKSPAFHALVSAAIDLDPFYVGKDSAGVPSWYRKRDHRLVPWRVVDDPTPDEQKVITP